MSTIKAEFEECIKKEIEELPETYERATMLMLLQGSPNITVITEFVEDAIAILEELINSKKKQHLSEAIWTLIFSLLFSGILCFDLPPVLFTVAILWVLILLIEALWAALKMISYGGPSVKLAKFCGAYSAILYNYYTCISQGKEEEVNKLMETYLKLSKGV